MKKYRLTLTLEELVALRDRLVPIRPMDYDLHTYAILRALYGRLDHIILNAEGIATTQDTRNRASGALET